MLRSRLRIACDILAFAAYLVAVGVLSAFLRLTASRPWAAVALAVGRLRGWWGEAG